MLQMLCNGEQNRLYAITNDGLNKIEELDCSEIPFKRQWSFSMKFSSYSDYRNLYYVPSPYKMLVTCDEYGTLCGISCEKAEQIWTIDKKDFPDREFSPHGMAFSIRHSVLLVCDAPYRRILSIDPKDGSQLQTIELGEMGMIENLCIYDDKLIMIHGSLRLKLSYFSVN